MSKADDISANENTFLGKALALKVYVKELEQGANCMRPTLNRFLTNINIKHLRNRVFCGNVALSYCAP
jgi:hypothetical protein